ncbi:DUF389 domain-containing protein [Salinigranum halophilum]|uniref:hypothetical protein n=1 Tax=Salinigranum halophilum TaxID=2565931 RepID=UPI00115E8F50|nr:hypothetical protein [Salinigranum halophilum]
MVSRKDAFEAAVVVGSLVVLGVSVDPVSNAASDLWRAGGIVHDLLAVFAIPLAGNLDIPVAFISGLVLAWALLFLLDGTKRVQGVLTLAVLAIAFFPIVQNTGRILATIGRSPVAFLIGLLLGFATGVSASRFYGIKRPDDLGVREQFRWVQFPAATGAFFYSISAVVVLNSVNYVLVVPSSSDGLVVLGSSVLFVFFLGVFTTYDYQRRIVVISPADQSEGRYHPYIIGGLYGLAETEYHGFPIEGDSELNSAQHSGNMRDLQKRFTSLVKFGFVSPAGRVLKRTVILESECWTTRDLRSVDRRYGEQHPALRFAGRIAHWVGSYLWITLVPSVVRREFTESTGDVLSRMDRSGTVLLVSPTPTAEEGRPVEVDVYADICKRYADSFRTDVVVATTEAASEATQTGHAVESDEFVARIQRRLDLDSCTVVPVDRFSEDQVRGFETLLREISK